MSPRNRLASQSPVSLAFALLLGLGACGQPQEVEVTQERTLARTDTVYAGASAEDRFGRRQDLNPREDPRAGQAGDKETVPGYLRENLAWDVPEGWVEQEASGMRIASLQPGGDPDADCSLILLKGSGGGLDDNVNRWRGQIGLAPKTHGEIALLPTLALLGQEAPLVDLDGTYSGMGGEGRADWHLRGVILGGEAYTLFLKFTAPAAVAAAEEAAFDAFCASIRLGDDRGQSASEAPAQEGSGESGALNFDLPGGWINVGPASMRAVNLSVGTSQCYVILLGGQAGGLVDNINRWRNEVGLAALSATQVEGLETIEVLGATVPLLDVEGDYAGMGDEGSDYRVFGVAVIRDSVSVFVKMVGPAVEMAAQETSFRAFLSSLEEM